MKLKEEYIRKYLNDFHYELTREQLEQEWRFDKRPYNKTKDCFNLHSKDGCWIEVAGEDVAHAFVDYSEMDVPTIMRSMLDDCDFQSSWDEETEVKTLAEIGKEEYLGGSYYAGVEHEKKVAIAACQKVIDAFYESSFNPTIDYMQIFKENL